MVELKVKQLFFDRAEVLRYVDKKTAAALSRIGAFVRTRARSSIRKRKAISQPGQPPSGHTGRLKDGIQFSFDPRTKSVVIGPTPYTADGAHALEFGGDVRIKTRAGRRAGRKAAARTVAIKARPYMGPALDKEIAAGTIPPQWASSVRG